MNKKIVLCIGVVLLLSIVNIGMVIVPSRATVCNKQEESIYMNSNSGDNGNSIYDLLIITPNKFKNVLQPLVDHKNEIGVSTKLATLDEVYDQMYWYGRDKPEKIKYFIKNAYDNWGIKYVLLVGDFRNMPIRYCYNSLILEYQPEPYFISELYYADIYDSEGSFSSWDTNENGIFGEWSGDEAQDKNIDLYPDVYVGRLACKDRGEVRVMVKKIITYEAEPISKKWFNRIVVVGGDTSPGRPGYEGEENTQDVLDNMSGFTPVKLWTSDGSFSSQMDVMRAVNNGCGFFYLNVHTTPFGCATHPPNDMSWTQGPNVITMSLMRNKEMLPVCVSTGCHNAQFDVHFGNIFKDPWKWFTWIPECWCWKLTRMSRGGSIATIGYSGFGIEPKDKESGEGASEFLNVQFFYEYGVKKGTHILGEAWGNAITNYLDHFPIDWYTPTEGDCALDAKTVQQWVLFGDPSLKIGGYKSSDTGEVELEIVGAVNGVSFTPGKTVVLQAQVYGESSSYEYVWCFEDGGLVTTDVGDTVEYVWYSPGVYQVSVKAIGTDGNEYTCETFVNIESKPDAPSGPTSGETGVEYTFTAHITSSSSWDQICYFFDWGDETFSDPLGPYPMGQSVEEGHMWSDPGVYQIRVKAWLINSDDDSFEETDWSDPLTITVTKSKNYDDQSQQSQTQYQTKNN